MCIICLVGVSWPCIYRAAESLPPWTCRSLREGLPLYCSLISCILHECVLILHKVYVSVLIPWKSVAFYCLSLKTNSFCTYIPRVCILCTTVRLEAVIRCAVCICVCILCTTVRLEAVIRCAICICVYTRWKCTYEHGKMLYFYCMCLNASTFSYTHTAYVYACVYYVICMCMRKCMCILCDMYVHVCTT